MLRTKLILALTTLLLTTIDSSSQVGFNQLLKEYVQRFDSLKELSVTQDSNNVSYSLKYFTPEIEAIKAAGEDSVSFNQLYLQKKDFHFFELSYWDKNQSLSTEQVRSDFLKNNLIESISVVNEKGDVLDIDKQFFPSRFKGMPNKIVVIVPSKNIKDQLTAALSFESMVQLKLIVHLEKIKTLPKISI